MHNSGKSKHKIKKVKKMFLRGFYRILMRKAEGGVRNEKHKTTMFSILTFIPHSAFRI
jgi:hypothetical protein